MKEQEEVEVKEEKKTQPQKSENKSTFTFTLKSLAVVLCLCSLGLTYLFAILLLFGVNMGAVAWAIFFLLTSLLAIAGMVLAYLDEKKFNMSLGFAIFTVLVTVIIYF